MDATDMAYRMRFVRSAWEVDHAVEARKSRGVTLVTVSIKLLLREDVPTALIVTVSFRCISRGGAQSRGEGKHGAHVPRRRTTP
jgi:ABC-type methionine transport system permease subunit